MAWESYKVEIQRLNMVKACLSKDASIAHVCKQYNISRKTAYKWCERYLAFGEEGLKDLSRSRHQLCTKYTQDQFDRAIDLKQKRRTWGPKKILSKLTEQFPDEEWPCPTRLYEVFKDYHLVTSRKLRTRMPATDPLGDVTACNNTWAVDLKGWFLTKDGQRCEPLTITDCFSRYLIKCKHLNKHSVEYVWPVFEEAFKEYGLPDRVRTDNGPPFGSALGIGRLSPLSINLIKAGVKPEWIEPGHPEQNGRHERFHLTLKQDTATPPKDTLQLQIKSFEEFYEIYNFERHHESLGMKTPASCYTQSNRRWDGVLRSPEYDRREVKVRKIGQSGSFWMKGEEHFIAMSLVGEYIGLKENENGEYELNYGPIHLGKLTPDGLERPRLRKRRSGKN